MSLGVPNVYHHHMHPGICGEKPRLGQKGLFRPDENDDVVLDYCGKRNWLVIGQDYRYHTEDNVRAVIKEHEIGVFYMRGANVKKWESFQILVRAWPGMIDLAKKTPRPFIFKGTSNSRWRAFPLEPEPRMPTG